MNRISLTLLLAAVAGCVYDGGYLPIDIEPPTVASTIPAGATVGADRDASIVVVFSEGIDESTANGDTIGLFRGSVAVEGIIATSSTAATFTPAIRLDDLSEYEIRVGTGIRDLVGLEMEAPFSASFMTEDLEWEPPILVTDTGTGSPSAGVSSAGEVIVVWDDPTGGLWFRSYSDGLPGATAQIDSGTSVTSFGVGVDDAGNAITIWREQSGARDLFWSRFSRTSKNWSEPVMLADGTGTFGVGVARVRVNGAGFAIASWNETTATTNPYLYSVKSRIFSPSALDWGSVATLDSRSETADYPLNAVSENGNAAAVWMQSDGTGPRLWGAYYEPFDGWTTATVIETSGNAGVAQPAMDGEGHAFVAVTDALNHFVPGDGWLGPRAVADALTESACVSENGLGLFAWTELAVPHEIHVRRFDTTGNLEPELETVFALEEAYVESLDCTIDSRGRATLFWRQEFQTRTSLVSARSTEPGTWSTPIALESSPFTLFTALSSLDIGPGGEIAIGYTRTDGVDPQPCILLLR